MNLNKETVKLQPKDVDKYNKLTAVPEYTETKEVHEKFWISKKIIAPRSHAPSWIKFKNIDFNKNFNYILVKYSVKSNCGQTLVDIRIDNPNQNGKLIGSFRTENTDGFNNYIERIIPLKRVEDIHDLYIIFEGVGNYKFFELRQKPLKNCNFAESPDQKQDFYRPDLSKQEKLHYFEKPMKISESLIKKALLQLKSNGSADFINGLNNEASRYALAILTTAVSQGIEDSEVVNKIVESISGKKDSILYTDSDNTAPYVKNSSIPYTLAVAWNIPEVKSKLLNKKSNSTNSSESTLKKDLKKYMKALLIDLAFTIMDFSPDGSYRGCERMRIDGKLVWTGGNPNFYERESTVFIYAATVLGLENVKEILNNYDHNKFLKELRDSNSKRLAEGMYDRFNETFFKRCGDKMYNGLSPELKAEIIDNYITNITNLEEVGKPFFHGLTLDEMLNDLIYFQYMNVLNRTFDKKATQGDYIGRRGMIHEFGSLDGGDGALRDQQFLRDDLKYSRFQLRQSLLFNYFLRSCGYWDQNNNSDMKETILKRMAIGFSDLQPKACGYWSTNFRGAFFKTLADNPFYKLGEQMAANLGFIRPTLFAENFENDNIGITWEKVGTWNIKKEETWTGRVYHRVQSAPDQVIESSPQNLNMYLSEFELDNFIGNVEMKIIRFDSEKRNNGVGIVGRYVNKDNYYIMRLNDKNKVDIVKVHDGEHIILKDTFYNSIKDMNFLKFKFTQDNLEMYLNSELVLSVQDNTFKCGKMGFYSLNTQVQFDNLTVTGDQYGDLGNIDKIKWL